MDQTDEDSARAIKPEIDQVWADPSADVVLVSSDHVAFHVPCYHILSQSTALRDAIQIDSAHCPNSVSSQSDTPRSKPVTFNFSDEDYETAESIRLFLSIATSGDIDQIAASNPSTIVRILLSGILFLQKYDCAPALHNLTSWLRKHAATEARNSKVLNALDCFIIGAKTGLDSLAVDAVKNYKPRGIKVKTRGSDGQEDGGERYEMDEFAPMQEERWCWGVYTGLDPAEFPIIAWEACPQITIWALSKACKQASSWHTRGELLESILDEVRFLR
ncbi:uncharacterized protein L203_105331 [Cryptococcus depauperatus CBS 7841]|uniref:Uncharacterized protein n=1 Tax=Cryptococcus depauperatus CBS 7841 TaxID=1295531 RepID=A0A1E3HLM8_9TREE|nr:hypothetical protein L203_06328 [Cryptococcus depauperatus CBS 7841]ODN98929.1 hypothetical protein L204_02897 [Cryptococcus depauperatus CBS 7855]